MSRDVRKRFFGNVRTAKIQISLCTGRILDRQWRLWSGYADTQTDLSLCRANMPQGMFSNVAAQNIRQRDFWYDAQRGKKVRMQYANSISVVQISMRIRAVCTEHYRFVDIYYSIHWFCRWATKSLISLRECTGWSGPTLSANCISPFPALRTICNSAAHTFRESAMPLLAHSLKFHAYAVHIRSKHRSSPTIPDKKVDI